MNQDKWAALKARIQDSCLRNPLRQDEALALMHEVEELRIIVADANMVICEYAPGYTQLIARMDGSLGWNVPSTEDKP